MWWDSDQITIALAFNKGHTIYYHMDALWSVRLVWTYVANPDYLVVICWVCATYLSPDTFNQMETQTYHYVKCFARRVGYTPLGTLCNCFIAIIDQSNAAMLFVITAYLA